MKKIKELEINGVYLHVIGEHTKRGESVINSYNYYYNKGLFGLNYCYSDYSINKELAYKQCLEIESKLNGFSGCISGYNCMQFSYTFKAKYNNKLVYIYITRDYNYIVM